MKKKSWLLLGLCLLATLFCGGKTMAATTLHNPKIKADSSMQSGKKVTWDCVYFGSYPQTEIVDKSGKSGVYGKKWAAAPNYKVNAALYSKLAKASGWDSNGDITIDGVKYRRIQKSDATYALSESDWNTNCYYDWSSSVTWHYFRYEPIKWRVLYTTGSKALLLSETVLDDQQYNEMPEEVTWATSTVRSWLNGYSGSKNVQGTDYRQKNFIDSAFTSSEQAALQTTKLDNKDRVYTGAGTGGVKYSDNYYHAEDGGADTQDKLFFLSFPQLEKTAYGFSGNPARIDEAKRCKSSAYAKAMGAYTNDSGAFNSFWWLRTPCSATGAMWIDDSGVIRDGFLVNDKNTGVRPACYLALSASGAWKYAGTVCSDGTVKESSGSEGTAKVTKKSQPMKVSATTKTLKAVNLKSKARTVTPLAVKSAKGTVTYKISSGTTKAKKALTINQKTGKITVKKGTKAGTYKVQVTVKAAGNSSYKSGSKVVTITVKVK